MQTVTIATGFVDAQISGQCMARVRFDVGNKTRRHEIALRHFPHFRAAGVPAESCARAENVWQK
jgi:hypothetical protein